MGSDLNRFFSRMGARVRVIENARDMRPRWLRRNKEAPPQIVLDIARDKAGEFFEIRKAAGSDQELFVLNVRPGERHLLLLSRQFDGGGKFWPSKSSFAGTTSATGLWQRFQKTSP